MLEKIRVVFTIPELRWKIFVTLGFLLIYRVGWQIPLPIVDQTKMNAWAKGAESGVFGEMLSQVAIFSASQLNQATIFGLGIMPYISASIIFQLLGSVYPPLEKLQKEGESGRKKINEYTRSATLALCLGQSFFYVKFLAGSGGEQSLVRETLLVDGVLPMSWFVVAVATMTAGTVFLMWIG
ncbi:MAG: preprotein translocase subunit SecY, partial [Planctomycetales bacterium]